MYEQKLIGVFNTRANYDKYFKYVSGYHLLKETREILEEIEAYYKQYPKEDTLNWNTLRSYIHIERHPTWDLPKHQIADSIIDGVIAAGYDPTVVAKLNESTVAELLKGIAQEAIDKPSTGKLDKAGELLEEYNKTLVPETNHFVDMDVASLVNSVIKGDGIEWRLEGLNISVGQVHSSDFIIIGKRPETGGTTFLTSEFTHMLKQLPPDKAAIIFNNEEGGDKVGLRVIQSALGIDSKTIEADPVKVTQDYDAYLGGRKIYVYDKPGMSVHDIRKVLKQHPECWLIGINVLDKLSGFSKLDEVGRYRKLAEFARTIAKEHGAVMAIAQADAGAEGVQYLDQTQLYGSKTGVQGEADVLLMIGKDHNTPDTRYISVAKNKKPTTGRMQTTQRHAKFPCKFLEDIGRFV